MTSSFLTRKHRVRLHLVCAIGVIVPRRLRSDWRQEWEAELRYSEMLLEEWDRLDWRSKLDLLRRSTSAFWDALCVVLPDARRRFADFSASHHWESGRLRPRD
jgi:hypothetical protein